MEPLSPLLVKLALDCAQTVGDVGLFTQERWIFKWASGKTKKAGNGTVHSFQLLIFAAEVRRTGGAPIGQSRTPDLQIQPLTTFTSSVSLSVRKQ